MYAYMHMSMHACIVACMHVQNMYGEIEGGKSERETETESKKEQDIEREGGREEADERTLRQRQSMKFEMQLCGNCEEDRGSSRPMPY